MENSENQGSSKHNSPDVLPSLIKYIGSNEVVGFDSIDENSPLNNEIHTTCFQSPSSSTQGMVTASVPNQNEITRKIHSTRTHSVSISMPSSPLEVHTINRVNFSEPTDPSFASKNAKISHPKLTRFHSQPIPTGNAYAEAVNTEGFPSKLDSQARNPRIHKLKDKRFDSFKTWSGKLERQLSTLRGKSPRENGFEDNNVQNTEIQTIPAYRYFAALEGPELDTLRASEELVLPDDKLWPFLLRYTITSFGICLGVSSQAILWKTLAISPSTNFLHISLTINLILWCISIALVSIVTFIYALKIIFYFEAVRREYYHPIRVNFFFAPFIAFLFLGLGAPPSVVQNLHASLWYVIMAPLLCLELKIYGQWMSGGQRRLSKVANPSNHLSIVGNFVGALLGATMGLKEGPLFFFAVGLAHYIVMFVTLYQRLPTNDTLPKELHPVFFLFVAAPSVASMAWSKITGSFDYGSKISYFIAMFLYFSLAVRVNFFRGFRFSLAWWAYTFPMTGAAIATIKYSNEVTNKGTQSLSLILSAIASLTSTALLVTTILRMFVFRDLFPNDIAIAIRNRKLKTSRNWYSRRNGSSNTKDNESSEKVSGEENKDLEASLKVLTTDK